MLCGIYLGLALISILLVIFFLNDFTKDKKEEKLSVKSQFKLIKSTFVHLKKRNQLLIIPITCWLGFEQGFLGADFTKVFFFI